MRIQNGQRLLSRIQAQLSPKSKRVSCTNAKYDMRASGSRNTFIRNYLISSCVHFLAKTPQSQLCLLQVLCDRQPKYSALPLCPGTCRCLHTYPALTENTASVGFGAPRGVFQASACNRLSRVQFLPLPDSICLIPSSCGADSQLDHKIKGVGAHPGAHRSAPSRTRRHQLVKGFVGGRTDGCPP
jgi:hypothetical protein